jgi:hypothetical protein
MVKQNLATTTMHACSTLGHTKGVPKETSVIAIAVCIVSDTAVPPPTTDASSGCACRTIETAGGYVDPGFAIDDATQTSRAGVTTVPFKSHYQVISGGADVGSVIVAPAFSDAVVSKFNVVDSHNDNSSLKTA